MLSAKDARHTASTNPTTAVFLLLKIQILDASNVSPIPTADFCVGGHGAPLEEEYLADEAREPDQEDVNDQLPCCDVERRREAPICYQVMVNRLDYHDEMHRVEEPIRSMS